MSKWPYRTALANPGCQLGEKTQVFMRRPVLFSETAKGFMSA